MKKAFTLLTASLALSLVIPAGAQTAPDSFKDVPSDHWAYQAVEALRSKGVLIGYPDGFYRGKRTLTRYEFAVALKRALDQVQTIKGDKGDTGPAGAAGATGPAGEAGPAGIQGPSGVAPEELAAIKKLADEFKSELASIGVNVNAVNAKIDKVSKDLAALKAKLDKAPKISGTGFWGLRVDRAKGPYVDASGNANTTRALINSPVQVRALALDINAKIGDDATVLARIVNDNYRSYLNGSFGYNGGSAVNANPGGATYLDLAEIKAPFGALGRDGGVTLGRIGFNLTPLTLWKPNVDTYFQNPLVDDGLFRMDGVSLATKMGSVGLNIFGGQTKSVDGGSSYYGGGSNIYNSPIAGGDGSAIFTGGSKPTAQDVSGCMVVDQLGGLSLTLPISLGGQEGQHIRAVAYEATGTGGYNFTNVQVYGVDTKLKLGEKIGFDAAWAKTITGTSKYTVVNPHQNNAADGAFTYGTGSLKAKVGYKYVEPLFSAPGYWGRIGNWVNPTNIQGPSVCLGYDFTPNFGLNVSGEMYTAAKDRSAAYGIGPKDEINRIVAGARWGLGKNVDTTLDWEGVYWKISGAHNAFGTFSGVSHPVEQYVNIGTGYQLTDAIKLKLGYQIGNLNGKVFTGGSGVGNGYTYNTFTSQVAVKF